MKQTVKHVVGSKKIVIMDTVSYLDESNNGDVVIAGSHCGASAAEYVIKNSKLAGIILNDAGKGKENAGIAGLEVYEKAGMPAAAVDALTARIGDGLDTYESGVISALNNKAEKCGAKIGMTAKETVDLISKEVAGND